LLPVALCGPLIASPPVIGSAVLIFCNRTGKSRLGGTNKSQPPLGLS